jgi:cell wall assembly regulator SMI1
MSEFKLEKLLSYWSELGGKLNPGAADAELATFEARYRVRLPDDIRQTLAAVNGCEAWDDNMITFLPVTEILPVKEYWVPYAPEEPSYFVFAEQSMNAFAYAIRLLPDRETGNSIAVFYERAPINVADSFAGFIRAYLSDDTAVLYPDIPA